MKQAYRMVGWMTELERGLTVEEWQEVMNRLNPELEYVPFEVSAENTSVFGLVDQELIEERDCVVERLTIELESLCSDWAIESDLREYPVLEGNVAYGTAVVVK